MAGELSAPVPAGRGPKKPRPHGQAQKPGGPASARPQPASPPGGDQLDITSIRARMFDLEAQIANLKLQEEQRLGKVLNDQLTYLEQTAAVQRATLNFSLAKASSQRAALPVFIEYQSIDYSYLKQIEGREQVFQRQIDRLDAYVSDMRVRSNSKLAQINAKALAGTTEIDHRITALRAMIGEISASPLTRDLLAERLR
ncbi:MAG: hypothetical protein FJZ01_16370 [Candidatus Sericytochromatia bacterium]|nr:hypothetical protein [Candidatus Tanganyikabacteria bacterium]